MEERKEKEQAKKISCQQPRKPYAAPQLTTYGHVMEFTQGVSGPVIEGFVPSRR